MIWQEGDVLDGRYEVVGLVGRGEMGEVYQIRHLQWGIDLAAKLPRTDALSRAELAQFAAEAQAWIDLGLHPNICSCYFVRRFDGIPAVFAEYVPDGSLQHWIKSGRLYEGPDIARTIMDVAIQFAWGLEYAHQRHLVHQDVKPANVLIDLAGDNFTVKITDFGLARVRAGTRAGAPARTGVDRVTEDGTVSIGGMTPAYASPEQAAGRKLSHRTRRCTWNAPTSMPPVRCFPAFPPT